jgi:hypothetical protein
MMKIFLSMSAIFLLTLHLSAATPAETELGQIKALAGDWEAKFPDGTTLNINYTPISNGTAVMEILTLPNGTDMRSIYHVNGDKLMMTHYCESGNQPRLQSTNGAAATPDSIELSFLDITNVPSLQSFVSRTKILSNKI